MRRDSLGVVIVVLLIVLAVMIVIAVVNDIVGSSTENRCAELGYPNSKVTWTLDRYCVKRVDQTDVVVPLDEAEAGRTR